MRVTTGLKAGQPGEPSAPEADTSGAGTHPHAPRKMTFAENVILTTKLLGGLGLAGAALWGIDLWTSAR